MKLRSLLLLLVIAALWLPLTAQEETPADALPDLEGRVITVAVENAYPPFNMLGEDGQGMGWDYDTVNEICRRLNCTPEFVETAWEGMILSVSQGQFDMAGDGITITEDVVNRSIFRSHMSP